MATIINGSGESETQSFQTDKGKWLITYINYHAIVR